MELLGLVVFSALAVVVAFGFYVNRKNIELRDNIAEEFKKFAEKSVDSAKARVTSFKDKL